MLLRKDVHLFTSAYFYTLFKQPFLLLIRIILLAIIYLLNKEGLKSKCHYRGAESVEHHHILRSNNVHFTIN